MALAGHWELASKDGSNYTADASGNGNHGLCSSGVSFAADTLPDSTAITCAAFDGTSSALCDVGDAASLLSIGDAFSFSAWVKPATAPPITASFIFAVDCYYATPFAGPCMRVRTSWFEWLERTVSPIGYGVISPASLLAQNTWAHIAITHNGPNSSKLFCNGELLTIPEGNSADGRTLTSSTGHWYIGSAGSLQPFNGRIARLWAFDSQITDEQIANLYLYNSLTAPVASSAGMMMAAF